MKRLLINSILASLAALSFISCDSGTDTGGATVVTPKAGTTYTYAKRTRDSTSGGAPQTRDTTIISTVISNGTTFEGKSNVVTLLDDGDTVRYVIESNGDVSVYSPSFSYSSFSFTNPKPWVTFTCASKATNVHAFDTVQEVSVQGATVPISIVGTVNYLGTDELKKNGNNFASGGQAQLLVSSTGSFAGVTVTVNSTRTISFDPALGGYFHHVDNIVVPDVVVFGQTFVKGSTATKEKILIDYSLIK